MTLEIGYFNSSDYNAFAATRNGYDLIAVSAAVPIILKNVMNALLDHPGIFPEVGDTKSCSRWKLSDDLKAFDLCSVEKCPPEPSDGERRILAQRLAYAAEIIILFHEFAHITNGHVDWLGEKFGLSYVDEVYAVSRWEIPGIDWQTIDFDADATAIQNALNLMASASVTRADDLSRSFTKFPDRNVWGSFDDALQALCFAAYVSYRIFSDNVNEFDVDKILNSTHPPGIFRIGFQSTTVETVLATQAGINPEDHQDAFILGSAQAMAGWSLVFGDPVLSSYEAMTLKASSELLARFNARWRDMQPELLMLKRENFRIAAAEVQRIWPPVHAS